MGKMWACCSAFGSKKSKSKKIIYGEKLDPAVPPPCQETTALTAPTAHPQPALPAPVVQDVKLNEANDAQSKRAYSVALATAAAAEAAVAAAQAAAEVVRLTTVSRFSGRSKEEIAAIKIQTAFRGYLARRALRALRGLVRLKSLIDGPSVRRQATSTLRATQALTRMQSQIRSRRIRMTEENLALQRQLQQKHERELEKLRASYGGQWDDSIQSKEKVEAGILQKHEAAIRRERALAYSFSHQQAWKNSTKSVNTAFIDPTNPQWGWSWLERWMASRNRESQSPGNGYNRGYNKSSMNRAVFSGDITRAYSLHQCKHENKPSLSGQKSGHHSPSTPASRTQSISSVTSKIKAASPRGSALGGDEDSRSLLSGQSEQLRRRSVATSSVRDDESFASSPSVPNYMVLTQSAKAKSRLSLAPPGFESNGIPDKSSVVDSAKKRLSFSASPSLVRRHSGPPRVDGSLLTLTPTDKS